MNVVRTDKAYSRNGVGLNGPYRPRPNYQPGINHINQALPGNVYGAPIRPQFKTPLTAVHSTTSCSVPSSTSGNGNTSTTSGGGGQRRTVRSTSTSSARLQTSADGLRTPRSARTPKSGRTPKSATSYTTDAGDSCCIVALSEGRGQARGEVGIAAVDTRRPHLTLCQISDTQSYVGTLAKINVFNPIEILVPSTFCEGQQPSKLFTSLLDTYPTVTLTTVQRRHFSDSRGMQQIQHLCAAEYSSVEILVLHKYYALSSASALLKYIEFVQNVMFAPRSLKVEYQGSQNTTAIDVDTSRRLELVRSLRGTSARHSLMGVLNHCRTAGGARALRATILQPPCLAANIGRRQACVRELVEDPTLFRALENVIGRFGGVELLLSLCMHVPQQQTSRAAETQLNYTLLLKTTLELLPPLGEAVKDARAQFFRSVAENLENEQYAKILARVKETVHDDARTAKGYAASNMQRSFSVKPGISGLLDVARKTYCEIVDDITTLVADLSQTHDLPMRVNYNSTRGFHIQLVNAKNGMRASDLAATFIQVQKSRSTLTFTTQELVHMDQRAKEALNEIQMLSNVVVYELLKDIREHIGCLYKLCENIAELDLVLSLAHVSAMSNYVRPVFGPELDVKKSRHPMLDFVSAAEPEPNDIYASRRFNCQIVTGPNMSGKSIYIRQVALLQVLAQVGCYVPAESAAFRIADRIFTRIGFDDSIECNASTFVLELRELQYIRQTLTPSSLVIIDEMCRGTSSEEGTAIAFAMCEDLLQTDAFVFLTTHFLFLTKLQDLYCNVVNVHMEVAEEVTEGGRSRLRYTHRLVPGVTTVENYGLRLAAASAMPGSVVVQAEELATVIGSRRKAVVGSVGSNFSERSKYKLVANVLKVYEAGDLTLVKCKDIQRDFCFPDADGPQTEGNVDDGVSMETEESDCYGEMNASLPMERTPANHVRRMNSNFSI